MKPEIFETRRVHKAVMTKMLELEKTINERADDNRLLMEQNESLHEKIDRLESSMGKMSVILVDMGLALALHGTPSRPTSMRSLQSGEVQVISKPDSVEDDGSEAQEYLENDQVPRIA
ncbi:MAG: hypothetical protein SGBAC_012765 [Bacillariaceae sp.]